MHDRIAGAMNAREGQRTESHETGQSAPTIYSIGYGSRTMPEFISTLKAHQIESVLDVRSAPYSKFKPEFTKQLLEHELQREGLRYVFLGDLLGGQPADSTCYADGKVDYERVRGKAFFVQGL